MLLSKPLRKHEVVPVASYMRLYKKGSVADIKGMSPVQKECPADVTMNTAGVHSVRRRAAGLVVNKQVKGKFLTRKINVRVEHIKCHKS